MQAKLKQLEVEAAAATKTPKAASELGDASQPEVQNTSKRQTGTRRVPAKVAKKTKNSLLVPMEEDAAPLGGRVALEEPIHQADDDIESQAVEEPEVEASTEEPGVEFSESQTVEQPTQRKSSRSNLGKGGVAEQLDNISAKLWEEPRKRRTASDTIDEASYQKLVST